MRTSRSYENAKISDITLSYFSICNLPPLKRYHYSIPGIEQQINVINYLAKVEFHARTW